MKKVLSIFKLTGFAYFIFLLPVNINAKIRNDYELTVKTALEANKGWTLYKKGVFVSKFRDGYYTDSDKSTRVKDFWSNGVYAKFDSDGDGYHETIFLIKEKELVYVGSLGAKGTFVHVSNNHRKLLHKPLKVFLEHINNGFHLIHW